VFVNEAGCFNDVNILNELLKIAKRKAGIVAIQLDIAKAFHTVPHEAIEDALRRKRIPQYVTKFIRDSNERVETIIKQGTVQVPMEIRVERGVKQGDPLSPLIFNAVLEPLIIKLESQKGLGINNECNVSSLAFADDMILLAQDVPKARRLLEITEGYLQNLGMRIAAPTCATFKISTTKDTWYLTDPLLTTMSGDRIPFATAETTIRYLGRKISPWKGITTEGLEQDFRTALQRVDCLALKPHQKAELFSVYMVPHYLFSMVLAIVPVAKIGRLDQLVCRVAKNIFHLPQWTANGLLY
jgi:hypothetical protein